MKWHCYIFSFRQPLTPEQKDILNQELIGIREVRRGELEKYIKKFDGWDVKLMMKAIQSIAIAKLRFEIMLANWDSFFIIEHDCSMSSKLLIAVDKTKLMNMGNVKLPFGKKFNLDTNIVDDEPFLKNAPTALAKSMGISASDIKITISDEERPEPNVPV